MIIATPTGDHEARIFEGSGLIPAPGSPDVAMGGLVRTPALQIASFACGVRLVSETIASLPIRVVEGDGLERKPVKNAPQARVFNRPAPDWTSFDVVSDLVASLELDRHALLWKVIEGGEVLELFPIDVDSALVTRDRATRRKVIKARIDGVVRDITANVIHIRSWAPRPSVIGIATPELHRRQLKTAISYDEFRGRYFDNDARPGVVLSHEGKPNPTAKQRKDIVTSWVQRHEGPLRANKPGVLWGGWSLESVGHNLKEAQAAELAEAIARDVARMLRIYPPELLHSSVTGAGGGVARSGELWADQFFRFSLLHRLCRIEEALANDRDLFPFARTRPKFDLTEYLRADISTTGSLVTKLVQLGLITKNEGRAMLGLPPLAEGGDVLVVMPVGSGGDVLGLDDGEQPTEGDENDNGNRSNGRVPELVPGFPPDPEDEE